VTQASSTVLVATAPDAVSGDPEEKVPWRAVEGIAIFIIAIIATVVVMIPLGLGLSPISGCGNLSATQATRCLNHRDLLTVLSILVNELALLITVILWVRFVHKSRPRTLGFRRFNPANVFAGIGIGVAGLFVAGTISYVLTSIIQNTTHRQIEAPKQISLQSNPQTLAIVIFGISVVLLAPIAEEAFFRGFVFQGLRKWARPLWAIVISAAWFGAAHLIPLYMLPIFGLGVLLASIVHARKSIVPSIAAHMTFNGIQFAILVAARKF
jgi:membrane protease YdiL (CAAX protease family)